MGKVKGIIVFSIWYICVCGCGFLCFKMMWVISNNVTIKYDFKMLSMY